MKQNTVSINSNTVIGTAAEKATKHDAQLIQQIQKQKRKTFQNSVQLRQLREKKEIWLLNLQEDFDKVYETLQSLLELKQKRDTLTQEEQKQFKMKIKHDIHETQLAIDQLDSLNQQNTLFHNSAIILEGLKNSLLDLIKLMKQILNIEIQQTKIDKLKIINKRNIRCQPLLKEIKQSTRRVQRIRAGNRLEKVLNEQLDKIQVPINKDEIQSEAIANNLDQILDKSENNLEQSPFAAGQAQHNRIKSQQQSGQLNNNMDQVIQQFCQKKKNLSVLIEKYIQFSKAKDLDFNQKYSHLHKYFKDRFSLVTLYLQEEMLQQFLKQNEPIENQDENNDIENQQNQQEDKYQDLEVGYIDPEDKNLRFKRKVIQINQEIKDKMLKEEHERRVEQIKELHIQQNQVYWNELLNKPCKAQLQQYINRRPLLSSQQQKRSMKVDLQEQKAGEGDANQADFDSLFYQVDIPQQQQQQQGIINQNLSNSSHKYPFNPNKQFYLNAHPDNPLLQNLFDSHQIPAINEDKIRCSYIGHPLFIQQQQQQSKNNQQLQQNISTTKSENNIFNNNPLHSTKSNMQVTTTAADSVNNMNNFVKTFQENFFFSKSKLDPKSVRIPRKNQTLDQNSYIKSTLEKQRSNQNNYYFVYHNNHANISSTDYYNTQETLENVNYKEKIGGSMLDDQPCYLKKFNNYKYDFTKRQKKKVGEKPRTSEQVSGKTKNMMNNSTNNQDFNTKNKLQQDFKSIETKDLQIHSSKSLNQNFKPKFAFQDLPKEFRNPSQPNLLYKLNGMDWVNKQ